jgi:DNA-directed RNA polymerase subunit M/transcription elongation factor TFIIS
MLEDQMAARRTDYQLEILKKQTNNNGFFACRKCRSKNTTYYQQQTRGADEPMTNFCSCI